MYMTKCVTTLALTYLAMGAAVANAQSSEPAPTSPTARDTYEFDAAVPVRECDFHGNARESGGTPTTAPPGARFTYLGEGTKDDSTVVILQFLNWNDTTPQFRALNVELTDAGSTRVLNRPEGAYKVSAAEIVRRRTWCTEKGIFGRTATRVYNTGYTGLAAGVLLLPIKMRGMLSRNFDFSKDVTLGTVAGPRFRIWPQRETFVSALVGAGISAVTLDSASTHGVVKQTTDRAAVTLTAGIMLDVDRFQIGAMTGIDRISNPNQNSWRYQGKPWLSIGLGYTLLSAPKGEPAEGNNK